MVKLLLDHLAVGPIAQKLKIYHVDARLSSGLDDVGTPRPGKIPLLLKYIAQAIWMRLRHGVRCFYYVPANPSRSTVYRDWLLMACCRVFFPRRILHWHAAGLGEWLHNSYGGSQKGARTWERSLTEWLIGSPTLSIVLSDYSRADASALKSRKIIVVPNGIPDPCCGDEVSRGLSSTPGAFQKSEVRSQKSEFKVLFLGLCTREKGLFDAVDAIELANSRSGPHDIGPNASWFRLIVAGTFRSQAEQNEFDQRIMKLLLPDGTPAVEYHGFVSGDEKQRLFKESHCFCFPTYYPAESFGLVLLEAMAHDVPIVATRWRMIPEVLPPKYPYLVEPQSPPQIAEALLRIRGGGELLPKGQSLRQYFLQNFTAEKFLAQMEAALLDVTT
jgi:glycosyltransferase involved in cell wall biosynthesis